MIHIKYQRHISYIHTLSYHTEVDIPCCDTPFGRDLTYWRFLMLQPRQTFDSTLTLFRARPMIQNNKKSRLNWIQFIWHMRSSVKTHKTLSLCIGCMYQRVWFSYKSCSIFQCIALSKLADKLFIATKSTWYHFTKVKTQDTTKVVSTRVSWGYLNEILVSWVHY